MAHETRDSRKDKMDVRWYTGIWVEKRERSGEAIVGTKEGCVKVRSISTQECRVETLGGAAREKRTPENTEVSCLIVFQDVGKVEIRSPV